MSAIRAASAFVELSLRQSAFTKGLRSAERALARTGAKVRGVGQALLAAGSGIAGGLAIPVSIFASFDDQIRQVKAVTGATAEEFEKLTNTAKELGRTTSFTAGEVASLMIERFEIESYNFRSSDSFVISTRSAPKVFNELPKLLQEHQITVSQMSSEDDSLKTLFSTLMKMHRGEMNRGVSS